MYTHVSAGRATSFIQIIKTTIIITLAIVLYGCGPQNIRKNFDPTAAESGGVIFGTATQNFDSPVSFVRFIYDTGTDIMIQSIDTVDQSFTAMAKPDINNAEDGKGRLFVFELKPGNHKIESYQITNGNFILYPKVAPPQLNFDIKAGEIM